MSLEYEENAAELQIGEDFLKAKCLMNCEVSLILASKLEQLQQTPNDTMNEVLEKSLAYVQRFSRYTKPEAVNKVRETLNRYQLAEFELGVIGNLCPESVEEAFTMAPSLKTTGRGLEDDAVHMMLNDLLHNQEIRMIHFFFICLIEHYYLCV
ncbi:DNA-directed RNA polymerase II subunit 4 [Ranunculus cassubicifolius]